MSRSLYPERKAAVLFLALLLSMSNQQSVHAQGTGLGNRPNGLIGRSTGGVLPSPNLGKRRIPILLPTPTVDQGGYTTEGTGDSAPTASGDPLGGFDGSDNLTGAPDPIGGIDPINSPDSGNNNSDNYPTDHSGGQSDNLTSGDSGTDQSSSGGQSNSGGQTSSGGNHRTPVKIPRHM